LNVSTKRSGGATKTLPSTGVDWRSDACAKAQPVAAIIARKARSRKDSIRIAVADGIVERCTR
jgi:hypothetical protein